MKNIWVKGTAYFAVSVLSAMLTGSILLFVSRSQAQPNEPKKGQWILTGQLSNSTNPRRIVYRFEDREYGIVCYSNYKDMSGSIGCAKR